MNLFNLENRTESRSTNRYIERTNILFELNESLLSSLSSTRNSFQVDPKISKRAPKRTRIVYDTESQANICSKKKTKYKSSSIKKSNLSATIEVGSNNGANMFIEDPLNISICKYEQFELDCWEVTSEEESSSLSSDLFDMSKTSSEDTDSVLSEYFDQLLDDDFIFDNMYL
jgi:hypothetical protein